MTRATPACAATASAVAWRSPASMTISSPSRRSAVIGGATGNSVVLLVASDTASLPPAGAAKVRLVHTVPKAPIYDSYLARPGWLDPRLAPAVDAAAARLAATSVTMEAHLT